MNTIRTHALRSSLRETIDSVASGTPVTITHYNVPVAVLIGVDHYAKLKADSAELRKLRREAKK